MLSGEIKYAKELAGRIGHSVNFVLGYFNGVNCRENDIALPSRMLSSSNDYGLGVQIGYRYGLDYLIWLGEPQQVLAKFWQPRKQINKTFV